MRINPLTGEDLQPDESFVIEEGENEPAVSDKLVSQMGSQ